jgi:serine/threonine-protein kinase
MTARYRILEEIAQGGIGVVLLAVHDGRPVAIKKLRRHHVDESEMVLSLLDEARIAARVEHPNVVRVRDVEMIDDELVIVMDYVEGISLRELLRGRKQLPIAVVRRILVDALEGLHAVHETDAVHRDVSPHNLLVDSSGVTRVTDFGIAKTAGRVASTTAPDAGVKGKLHYLAPEQVLRKPVDRRTDVFAAGAVAWECLAGSPLFVADTASEVLAMILSAPIVPPSVQRLEVPLDLDEACLRALERDPDRRYESAKEFARAIEEGGPLASREEVAALVMADAGATVTRRRDLLVKTPAMAKARSRKPLAIGAGAVIVIATLALVQGRRAEVRSPSPPLQSASVVESVAAEPAAPASVAPTTSTLQPPVPRVHRKSTRGGQPKKGDEKLFIPGGI